MATLHEVRKDLHRSDFFPNGDVQAKGEMYKDGEPLVEFVEKFSGLLLGAGRSGDDYRDELVGHAGGGAVGCVFVFFEVRAGDGAPSTGDRGAFC